MSGPASNVPEAGLSLVDSVVYMLHCHSPLGCVERIGPGTLFRVQNTGRRRCATVVGEDNPGVDVG